MSFEFGLTASLGLESVQYNRRSNMSDSTVFLDDPLGESRVWPIKIFTLGRFQIYRANEPLRYSGKVQRRPLRANEFMHIKHKFINPQPKSALK